VNHYDFSGRIALVTGAASGIGKAAAAALQKGGARVAALDVRSANAADLSLEIDVADPAAVRRAVGEVERTLGGIDVLVHAAGVGGPLRALPDLADEEWRTIMAVNADGTFYICREVVPRMVERGYGRIVLVSSIAGKDGNPLLPAYAASKAAVIAIAKSLGRSLAGTGVLVNAIAPAVIETPLATNQAPETIAQMVSQVPLGRMGTPLEAAALIAWLASEDCSFSTGAVYDLSGGRATW
jgi:NAD(P)-dependent dehydrogenase (short-subunit alcohol dehydrogenase family)